MTAAKATAPRIFWDEDDNEKLAASLWEMGVHSAKHPNLLNLVREQQHKVLAPNRIRTHLVGINHIRKFIDYFDGYAKRQAKQKANHNHIHIVKRTPRPEAPPVVEVAVPEGVDIDLVHAPAPEVAAPVPEPTLVMTPPPPVAKEPEPLVPPKPQHPLPTPLVTHAMVTAFSDSADLIMETLAGALAERFVKHLRRALTEVADREVAAFLHGTAEPIGATQPQHVPPTQTVVAKSETTFVPADVPVPTAAPMDDRPQYAAAEAAYIPHDAPDEHAHMDPPPPTEVVPNAHPFREEARPTLAVQPRAKKKVGILGLPPGQLSHVNYETRKRLDIKVIDQTLSQSELQHRIAHCDVLIGAWGIGKVARGVAKTHPNYILIEGGLTQLKRQLDAMV